jgi:small glutamine-rich tetratricopeptide repeat-containing protein alpha
MKIHPLIMLI